MKVKYVLAVAGLAATVSAAPAPDADCYAYGVGQKQCPRPTVTVAAEDCTYTACPGVASNCHAEWLWTTELVEVPCYNKCCPELALATVTSACAVCPTTCTPVYTQTILQYAATCTAPAQNPAASGQAFAGAHGPSVMDVQAGLNKMLAEQGEKPLWHKFRK
ncbi:hypothetical protein SEUCBS139899_009913 [Sporothrix eucalyptigena]